jgi:predicted pyridoxine 5'-phosphate oxidase superfamily flavin-nucleotide-binding protein
MNTTWHAGEQALHARLGMGERLEALGPRVVRDQMPDQHRAFFEQLPFVLVGSVDAQGRPWASVLAGAPGFMHSPDAHHLDIAALPIDGDPLAEGLHVGAPLGLLGIEPQTRRRNRMNGHVTALDGRGFTVAVDQSLGNCPKYIHPREAAFVRDAGKAQATASERLIALDAEARELVRAADTLFVATHAASADGADVSHRGGPAGFVHVEDDRTLLVPDYLGNFFFMTLGNLEVNPRAGVLFIDFERGDLLSLSGRTETVWDAATLATLPGAQRAWRLHLQAGVRLRDALPLRWVRPAQGSPAAVPPPGR